MKRNRIIKLTFSLISIICFFSYFMPSLSIADNNSTQRNEIKNSKEKTQNSRIVVSMGDSYSSGEGIEPFYGTSTPGEGIEFADWLAHRSKNSWAGQLSFNDIGELRNSKYGEKGVKEPHWYFVASSGAETKDVMGYKNTNNVKSKDLGNSMGSLQGHQKTDPISDVYSLMSGYETILGQEKIFSTPKNKTQVYTHTVYLHPQIDILKSLNNEGIVPDYITITIGGNDLGFADVISEAACFLLEPGSLTDILSDAREKLDKKTRHDIHDTFKTINDTAKIGDKQPCILVGGYPGLLDINGKGLPFNKKEAYNINSNVEEFNRIIKEEVENCREEGMNIEFVDVLPEFYTHEAYSDDPWINKVILISRKEDIDKSSFVSSASMHPNNDGATKGYWKCFQTVINKIEGVPTPGPYEITISDTPTPYEIIISDTPTPTPTPDPSIKIDETNFPDKEFRRCISNEFDLDHNGTLSPEEISKVTYFDLYDQSGDELFGDGPFYYAVENLQGIEYFSNLEGLEVPNDIKNIDISKNPKLTNITVFECKVENITIRCGQTITLDHITASAWQSQDRAREYLVNVSDDSIVSRSFPVFGSEATKLTGIKAGEVTVSGKGNDLVIVEKITVLPDDSYKPESKAEVSINNAVDKQFTYEGDKYDYKIPEISISGKDTKSVNKKIKKDLKKYPIFNGWDNSEGDVPVAITYTKYVDDNIISICVRVQALGFEEYDNEYYIYNISIQTGKLMKDNKVVKYCDGGYTDYEEQFFENVRTVLSNIVDKTKPNNSNEETVNKVKNNNNDMVNNKFKEIKPFVSEIGHFCIVAPIEFVGSEAFCTKVDMYTQEAKLEGTSVSSATTSPDPVSVIAIDKKHFPDSEFRRLVKDKFDKNKDGKLSVKERNAVKEFDTYDESGKNGDGGNGPYTYGVKNPNGIEYFTELKNVCFKFSEVTSIDMTKNSKLKNVEFFDSIALKKAVMLEGQTLTYSFMEDGAVKEMGSDLYCKSSNSSIVKVSRAEKNSKKTLVTAKKAGETTIKYLCYERGSCTITVKAKTTADNSTQMVKVSDAVNKKFKYTDFDGTYPYKIPKITISGKDMKSINNKILKDVNKYGTSYTVTYSYYVDEKIISIIVDIHETGDSATGHQLVYNVSVTTGKLLDDSEVVKMWGSTDKEFFSIAKKLYKKLGKTYGDVLSCNNPISYKHIDPFIGKNGHLCFTSYLDGIPPVGSDAVMFDTKTEKYSILSFSDYHFF